jgi:hypothetical protein
MKVIKHKDRWYLQSDTGYKEILLSTDTELQKDGIQAIDDTFLEWLVKNPSCESVEVETTRERNGYHSKHKKRYKIIIPKEPKQETLEEAAEKFVNNTRYRNYKVLFIEGAKWQAERIGLMEIELNHTKTLLASCEKALEDRDKQAERMYSSLFKLRNELCDTLPTGDVDAFELLKLINIHLQKLDNLCGNK